MGGSMKYRGVYRNVYGYASSRFAGGALKYKFHNLGYKNSGSYGNKFFDTGAKRSIYVDNILDWEAIDWLLWGSVTLLGITITGAALGAWRDSVEWSESGKKEDFERLMTNRKALYDKTHAAVLLNMPRTLEKSIKRGADIDAANKLGETPIKLAVYNSRKACLQVLLKHGAKADYIDPLTGDNLLQYVIFEGNINMAKQLVPHVDVNNVNHKGENALHIVIRKFPVLTLASHTLYGEQYYELAEKLLEKGIDLDQKNADYGDTPLHLAAKLNDLEMLELLTKDLTVINPWIRNKGYCTPLETYIIAMRYRDKYPVDEHREYLLLKKFYEDAEAHLENLIIKQEALFFDKAIEEFDLSGIESEWAQIAIDL